MPRKVVANHNDSIKTDDYGMATANGEPLISFYTFLPPANTF